MPPRSLEDILKQNPKVSRTDLEYLQEWMSKQPHLPSMTDEELVPFLHTRDYSLEQTKECLDKYFTFRTHVPEIFAFRDPAAEPCKTQWEIFRVCFLGRDPTGSELVCGWIHDPDPYKFDVESGYYLTLNGAEVVVRDNPTADGYTLILDSRRFSMTHVTRIPPLLLMNFAKYVQEGMPMRFNAIHVINVTPVLDFFMSIMRPFLSKDFQSLIHFYKTSNMDDFYKHVPKKLMPEEYGGNFGSGEEAHRKLQAKIFANTDWLRQLDRRVADESRRPGESKSAGDIFGMDGSFKKLDID